MTRSASTLDRIAAALVGLTLIVLGVAALIWNTTLIPGIPTRITAAPVVDATSEPWWPWAMAAAGVLLVIAGARWLLVHSPAAKTKPLPVHDENDRGTITVDLGSLADAAAHMLAERPNVQSAKGKAVIDRGIRTIDLAVTVEAGENLPELADAVDAVCADLAYATGDRSIASRTIIRIDKTADTTRRLA
ncbi:MAG: alkaline shock response membrane anchor protein AmaP [Gordonia sp. (in: high G+C Gram-positive bacteria)]|nr:MAG: alkaline shock response membrane anchor protein AmaP [Gordonia sp. (in: high G+C Gram-positive bacteria)]